MRRISLGRDIIPDFIRGFICDGRGLAAVEFAFVLPVMLTMFFGMTQLSEAMGCRADVTNLASTGSDLIAQESQVSSADLDNVFGALGAMLYPYDITPVKIVITSIIDDGSGGVTGKVAWSDGYQNGKDDDSIARGVGTTVTLPVNTTGSSTPFIATGGSVILTEVTYTYPLPVSVRVPGMFSLTGPYTMSNSFYSHPRRVAQIARV